MTRAVNQYSLPLRPQDVQATYTTGPAHKGKLKHSIDFCCEEGSRILAAAGGLVVYVKQDSNAGGPHRRHWHAGNRIVIRHQHDEYTAYEHLRHNGALVRIGQRVRKGQCIGYSGNTGFSYCPHLHFEVFDTPNADESEGTTRRVSLRQLLEDA